MYMPKHHVESRPALLQGLIRQHPLGTLITHGEHGLSAEHIPFELVVEDGEAHGVLRGHVARANPVWRHAGDALVVFQGASVYVSPSLYEEKAVSGKVVPTWNYAVVHAHGPLRAIEDPVWLMAMLESLTVPHEATRAAPWSVHDAPKEFTAKLLAAIVGIEIPVRRIDGKWKMSQNRSERDRQAIAQNTGLSAFMA